MLSAARNDYPASIVCRLPAPIAARSWLEASGYRLLPFDLKARAHFEAALSEVPTARLSDYSFANNMIWLTLSSGFWQIIEDCFCLFMLSGNGLGMMLPPLGSPDDQVRALEACAGLMDEFNASGSDVQIEYVYPDMLALFEPGPEDQTLRLGDRVFNVVQGRADYIYETQALIELKGHPYRNKRNEINQFRATYPDHEIMPFRPSHREAALELLDGWMQHRLRTPPTDAPMSQMVSYIEYEHKAIQRSIALYDELDLVGLSLFVGGRMAGFTFGERIGPDVASVLIEKTDFAVPGAPQYIFREFAKVLADCTWLNVGDDLGIENLKRVKMSYRPASLGAKVSLVLRREG